MRRSLLMLIVAMAPAASCARADAPDDPGAQPASAPATSEPAPVTVPGDIDVGSDSMAAPDVSPPSYSPPAASPVPRISPPELGKDSIPAGSGRGKGRPPRRSDSLPAGSGQP